MGEPMRFAGKVDGWYYALTVGVNVMLAWPLTSFSPILRKRARS